MSLVLAMLAPMLAQVGPFTPPGTRPASPLPPEVIERQNQERRRPPKVPTEAPPPSAQAELDRCLAGAEADPLAAIDYAQAWRQKAKGAAAAQAGQCLGVAFSRLERWAEAEAAFATARAEAADNRTRARLGAMAGNAALARGASEAALAALDAAHADALAAGDTPLAGGIAVDRARALVALKRDAEAVDALAEARAASPGSAQAWLLSATLSRRRGKLAEAQTEIEKAAELLPIDPEIGLEAGVIAVLSGRDEAARRSWQSVIAAAPDSEAAATAKGYLAQLDQQAPAREATGP